MYMLIQMDGLKTMNIEKFVIKLIILENTNKI